MGYRRGAMESLVKTEHGSFPNETFWAGKRVILTGHTGFKGSWLAAWLVRLGAQVTGLALPPSDVNSLYKSARLERHLESRIFDIRDREKVEKIFSDCRAEIVIHMAGQSILRHSYIEPAATYDTNVMGTINVLEGARHCNSVHAMVMVTSDKCYENREQKSPYCETDQLGGYDPYSSSKACAELAIAGWRRSFFDSADSPGVASARAGNVIGGGDWGANRLVPDCIRAFMVRKPVRLRNPDAVRPWQHVLEPLRAYLILAERLWSAPRKFSQGWNFGPAVQDAQPVRWVAQRAADLWGNGAGYEIELGDHPHEATMLLLDIRKAAAELAWEPSIDLARALEWTIDCYRRLHSGDGDTAGLIEAQIVQYGRMFGR